jgi:hypothetical protein
MALNMNILTVKLFRKLKTKQWDLREIFAAAQPHAYSHTLCFVPAYLFMGFE